MNLQIIHEHTVDLDLLPEMAKVMDIGCRGFEFTIALRKLGHIVWPIDIDYFQNYVYNNCAILGYTGRTGIQRISDPQGTKTTIGDEIKCYTISDFSKEVGIEFWDLIKMDIEGSEYEVIMSIDNPPAKQFSIEFHLHCGQTLQQVTEMVLKLESLGYEAVSHELTDQHGAGKNYWDSLFILK